MYRLLKPLLFALPEEIAHEITLDAMAAAGNLRLSKWVFSSWHCPRKVMGLIFENPVGLAAGLDKNGDAIDGLGDLGFGFLEVGTVTPRPQRGNPRPRLFRLREQQALINRMGFNNAGIAYLIPRLARRRYSGILGVNIGKNSDTDPGAAAADYVYCLEKVYPYADYVAINLSSPNSPGLRELQHGEPLDDLLACVSAARSRLEDRLGRRKPLLVKISPDLSADAIAVLSAKSVAAGIDGLIAGNTTTDRKAVADHPHGAESGGLSGRPLHSRSLRTIRRIRAAVGEDLAIIGCGGIMTPKDALKTLEAGADLIQTYTGLIFYGPRLPRDIAREIDGSVLLLPNPQRHGES